jgi:hypothetical protein
MTTLPAPSQITELSFDLESIVTALIVASGLHEGRWTLGVQFIQSVERIVLATGGITVGGITAFHSLRLTRIPADVPADAGAPVVDAAMVNPAAATAPEALSN